MRNIPYFDEHTAARGFIFFPHYIYNTNVVMWIHIETVFCEWKIVIYPIPLIGTYLYIYMYVAINKYELVRIFVYLYRLPFVMCFFLFKYTQYNQYIYI